MNTDYLTPNLDPDEGIIYYRCINCGNRQWHEDFCDECECETLIEDDENAY